jgi:hypothetical protein
MARPASRGRGNRAPRPVLRVRRWIVPARQSRSSRHRSATSPGRSPNVARQITIARSRCPHGVAVLDDASTCSSWSSRRHRGSVDNRQNATVGIAASSRSSANPSNRRNRKKDRSAVRTVFIDRGEKRPLSEATNVMMSAGRRRTGSIGSSPRAVRTSRRTRLPYPRSVSVTQSTGTPVMFGIRLDQGVEGTGDVNGPTMRSPGKLATGAIAQSKPLLDRSPTSLRIVRNSA